MNSVWTEAITKEMMSLRIKGHTAREISEQLSDIHAQEFTVAMVQNKIYRSDSPKFIEKDPYIKTYRHRSIADGNYMISCDYHAPFFSELWVNHLLVIAKRFKVRKHIIVGDLFDMDWAKAHPTTDGEKRLGLDNEADSSNPLIQSLLQSFDKNYLICGNHETRAARNLIHVQFRHIAAFLGLDLTKERYVFTEYDKMELGTKWLLVHPKSYSQISGAVAIRLAEKYHRNILNAHGHFIALRYDRSGLYMGIDLGGMFDARKVGYASLITTTHPSWNNGFGMIKDGYFYHFHDGVDFRQWQ